ncbi:MAG: DUF72 domain-containing protein [Myxococcota bacterium]
MARVYLGTSGFSYKEWSPAFYPADLSDKEYLRHYASRLDAVEMDSTFYRMPNRKTIDGWIATTPETFRFALKCSQKVTHVERLKLPSETMAYWLRTIPLLGARLGVVLYQLAPSFKRDVDRLRAFLAELPQSPRSAFEFRDASWFTPEIYALLEQHRVGLCINDEDGHATPVELTSDVTYVRLRREQYSAEERGMWRERLRGWATRGVEVFAFVKHEENPDAPLDALQFAQGLNG